MTATAPILWLPGGAGVPREGRLAHDGRTWRLEGSSDSDNAITFSFPLEANTHVRAIWIDAQLGETTRLPTFGLYTGGASLGRFETGIEKGESGLRCVDVGRVAARGLVVVLAIRFVAGPENIFTPGPKHEVYSNLAELSDPAHPGGVMPLVVTHQAGTWRRAATWWVAVAGVGVEVG